MAIFSLFSLAVSILASSSHLIYSFYLPGGKDSNSPAILSFFKVGRCYATEFADENEIC
jgi:hypothetical protein